MNWNHLIFEGYCGRKWSLKGSKCFVSLDGKEKIPNKTYDPKYRTPRKPSYCKNKVCFNCWNNNCKFLVMIPVDKETYVTFMKSWYNYK